MEPSNTIKGLSSSPFQRCSIKHVHFLANVNRGAMKEAMNLTEDLNSEGEGRV